MSFDLDASETEVYGRHKQGAARSHSGADLGRLLVLVLLLVSDQDQIITPDHHDALVAALPHARQARLRAGHGAPLEAMSELLGHIVAFADAVTTAAYSAHPHVDHPIGLSNERDVGPADAAMVALGLWISPPTATTRSGPSSAPEAQR